VNRRDSLKLLVAATGSIMLPAGWVTQARSMATGKPRVTGPAHDGFAIQPAFTPLVFGEIVPKGWILAQMQRDLRTGFAGHLDEFCHEVSSDIFSSGRNRPGKPNNANVTADPWWNGESEGNWRCGQMMMACLTRDTESMAKADAYVKHILASQDADGYIGIFSPELRYRGNGELWTQTCLFRGLLAYADATGNEQVHDAVKRAVDCTIEGYRNKELNLTWHDALYTDVLEDLYTRTKSKSYLDFALRLYHASPKLTDFFQQPIIDNKFNQCFRNGHGATVVEAMRMPFWFWLATGDEEYLKFGVSAIAAMNEFVMPSGAVVSEESIDAPPRPWNVGYEYCSILERQVTLLNAGQKKGDAAYFQAAEHLWFNAAQGSREPDGSAILYCSYENRLSIHDEMGKRQRFSPTHEQVAVCCCPNSTRVASYFIRNAWMRPTCEEPALVATLYGPCEMKTQIAGVMVRIEEDTQYPYANEIEITVHPERPVYFCLWLRDPEWSDETKISCSGARIRRSGTFWQVRREWKAGDTVHIHFHQEIREVRALGEEVALQYGPLLYALPVPSEAQTVKTYAHSNLTDYYVTKSKDADADLALPAAERNRSFGFVPKAATGTNPDYPLDQPGTVLSGTLLRKNGQSAPATLVPIGAQSTRLRRVTFPIA